MEEWFTFEYEGTSGERCDVALTMKLQQLAEFKDVSRSKVQALIIADGVVYDGKLMPRSQKNLRPGMLVELNLDTLRAILKPQAAAEIEPVDLPLEFLHVDEQLAVVVKPAGISVHPSPTEDGPALTSALVHHLGRLADEGGADRPGIVHRLDKETSGLLVIARDNTTHARLSRLFADRLIEKEYQALCLDSPEPRAGRIDLPIERNPRHRQRMWAGGHGRSALTEYQLAEMWGPLALIDVAIFTGRTHQIRVHLLEVGASILNDNKYSGGRNGSFRKFLRDGGDRNARRQWREAWPAEQARAELLALLDGFAGIFLHARRLAFQHPATGETLEFTVEPPPVWQSVAAAAGRSNSL